MRSAACGRPADAVNPPLVLGKQACAFPEAAAPASSRSRLRARGRRCVDRPIWGTRQ